MLMSDFVPTRLSDLIQRDWKMSNRLGGYASSTVAGMNTCRSHGLLVAPMTHGARRMVLLSRVEESLRGLGKHVDLGCNEYPGTTFPRGDQFLQEFGDSPAPVWTYGGEGWVLEKRLRLLQGRNAVVLSYRLMEARMPMELTIRPLFALRAQRELMYQWNGHLSPEKRTRQDYRIPATHRTPEVFFSSDGAFDPKGCWYYSTVYRGNNQGEGAGMEDLWCAGLIHWTLVPGGAAHFISSTDPMTTPEALRALREEMKPAVTKQTAAARVIVEKISTGFEKQNPNLASKRSRAVKK